MTAFRNTWFSSQSTTELSRTFVRMFCLFAALLVSGCKNQPAEITDLRGSGALAGTEDHLARAIATLRRADQMDQQQARAKVVSQLGQWIERQPPVDDWSVDPLYTTLPEQLRFVFRYAPLDQMQFVATDYDALSEAVWLNQISTWQMELLREQQPALFRAVDDLQTKQRNKQSEIDVVASDFNRKVDPPADGEREKLAQQLAALELEIKQIEEDLHAAEHRLKLMRVRQLFDWTVRNIQLNATNWDAELPVLGEEAKGEMTPPPGGEFHVWQSLLLGRGDAVTRARIFLLLCRQQRIDAVVLGVKSGDGGSTQREWAVGTLIDDDVYLFDADLGLPVPGPDGATVATLSQVRGHPELLQQLGTEEFPYFMTAQKLPNVIPLIDAGLESLSQRMLKIEQTLDDEQPLHLTSAPSILARRLRGADLRDAEIWQAPYRAYLFDAARQTNKQQYARFHQGMSVFQPPMQLWAGRLHHFRGQVGEPGQDDAGPTNRQRGNYTHGARYHYLACRQPEGEIESVQKELEKWFASDSTKSRAELLRQLALDMYLLGQYQQRRSALKAGDIDPAEQFFRQQLEAEVVEQNPDAAAAMRRSQTELTAAEMEDMKQIEARLSILSPTTRGWIKRLPPQVLTASDENRGTFIEHLSEVAAAAKQHATWWLGIAALEDAQFGVAVSFFQQRIAESDPDSPWAPYANGQLGRALELAGQQEKAIAFYQQDQSPQRPGSLVRAKLLAESKK